MKSYIVLFMVLSLCAPAFALQDISKMSDDEFLDMVEHDSVMYYVKHVHPKSGLIAYDGVNTHIGSNGFALNAFCIGAERKYIAREEAAGLALKMLETFRNTAANHEGAFQWMSDAETASKGHAPSFDLVETAYVCAGALACKQYFNGQSETEKKIRQYAGEIYSRVRFDKFMLDSGLKKNNTLAWSYESDKKQFSDFRINGYNECMIVYILALGAPKYPASPKCWDGWAQTYSWRNCYGNFYFFCPPMFTHQYSLCWADLRDVQDKYTKDKNITYFENSRRAAISHIAYAKENPKQFPGYGPIWGLTDCGCPLHPNGFGGHAIPDGGYVDDGTVAVSGAGASIMFTPKESIACLRHVYELYGDKMYDEFGFRSAFNVTTGWVDANHDMLNKGAMLTAIENYRSGLIWAMFMKNREIQAALRKAGFKKAAIKEKKPEKESKYETAEILEYMDVSDGWDVYCDKGASVNYGEVSGKDGNALQVSYNFGSGGWICFSKPLYRNLEKYEGISFDYYTEGAKNKIEVKIENEGGTVYGYVFPAGKGRAEWTTKEIPFGDMWYFWGGDGELNFSKVRISIAVSKDEGGFGKIVVDNLRAIIKAKN
ncbi:MAG: glucoamylase family protein [Elusimicrobiota bacterium]